VHFERHILEKKYVGNVLLPTYSLENSVCDLFKKIQIYLMLHKNSLCSAASVLLFVRKTTNTQCRKLQAGFKYVIHILFPFFDFQIQTETPHTESSYSHLFL
jgi:hypothetical protein